MSVQPAPELLTVDKVLEQLAEETRPTVTRSRSLEIETAFTAVLAGQQINIRVKIEWTPPLGKRF